MLSQTFCYTPPQIPYLRLIYLDDDLMVVDKPSGLLSVPGRPEAHQDSVLTRVRELFAEAQAVHRLDLDTQGLLLIPLHKQALSSLGRQFEQRTVHKSYLALVRGHLSGSGQVDRPLRCDWERRPLQIIDEKQGKPALTLYESLELFSQHSLLRLTPKTGRSHQLRVHLQSLGHPIEGDRFYAPQLPDRAKLSLCLAAVELSFVHPRRGTLMQFTLPDYEEQFRQCAHSLPD
ncbi:MAG: RNA pseudouridine synthase [Succinivibrio sp.]|nr:RNA pseudouridine synthase [Succinivibrio sp.]